MKEYTSLELISLKEATDAATRDAASQSVAPEAYVKNNILTYYLVMNTWVMLWRQYTLYAWHRFRQQLTEQGLIPTIKLMEEEATRIVNAEDHGPWAQILYSEIRIKGNVIGHNCDTIGVDEDATVLFLTRFPKRFSPVGNDKIQEATLQEFVQTENRSKLLQRRRSYAYSWAVEHVRRVINSMYDWSDICNEIDQLQDDDIMFSSGSALDAAPTLGSKITAICRDGNHTGFIQPIFGVYTLTRYAPKREGSRISSIQAVPKSYKSSRIIAMERTYPIAKGKAIEMIFRRHEKMSGINLERQDINQELAQYGSLTGELATLDASHASDLITKSLFVDLFPPSYVARVKSLLPDYYSFQDQIRPLQMSSTSGHTLTFRHETIVYKAIAQAALEVALALDTKIKKPLAHAYGDDTIVSSEAYEVALYFFSRLGLIINDSKSYATGNYRESCGKDYIMGVDVTSVYYPRFPVVGFITKNTVSLDSDKVYNDEYRGKIDNSLTMLIDLQKKLFPYSYDCARFLASVIQTAYPSITTSVVGTECNDLWDFRDSGKITVPQAFRLEHIGPYAVPRLSKAVKIGPAEEALHGTNLETFIRAYRLDTRHVYPSERFKAKSKYSDNEIAVYEYWKYISFLRSGPRFESGLDELLGITQKPMSIAEFYGKKTLELVSKR